MAFSLPAATGGRFLLLIGTTLTSAAYVYAWLADRVDVVSADPATCSRMARDITASMPAVSVTDWYDGCIRQASVRLGLVVGIMLAALVVVSFVLYLVMPGRIARRYVPLTGAAHLLDTVRREAPRRRPVELLVDMTNSVHGGRAFGCLGRYRIVLDVGELHSGRADAILAHELAHLRNRDIDMTYLAIAVWWGFLAAVAVPFLAVAASAPEQLRDLSWRLALLLGLLWVIRASVLRTRELYADVRAGQGMADQEQLVTAIETRNTKTEGRFGTAFRNHPRVIDRVATIRDGTRLFRLDPIVAAATGTLIGLGLPPALYVILLFEPDDHEIDSWLVGLTFGGLAASVLSGLIWRATLRSLADGSRLRRTWPTALAFAGGLLAGQAMTPNLPAVGSWLTVLRASPLVALTAAALLTLGCFGYVRWTAFCAAAWLPAARRPRLAYRFGVLQSALVVGLWIGFWFRLLGVLADIPTLRALAVPMAAIVVSPALLLSIVWACAYPLAAAGGRSLRTVNRVAAGVLLAYLVVPVLLHGQLLSAMERMVQENAVLTPKSLMPLFVLLLPPAVVLVAAGSLLVGLIEGGRGRGARALAAAGVLHAMVAVVLYPLMLAHLVFAVGATWELLRSIGRMFNSVSGGAGAVWLILFAGGFVVGIPMALVGSLIRALSARPRRPPPTTAERRWKHLARLLPITATLALLAVFGFSSWASTRFASTRQATDQGRYEAYLADPAPGTMTRQQVCESIADFNRAASVSAAIDSSYLAAQARLAVAAQASDDPMLRALGTGAAESMWLSEFPRASRRILLIGHYCASAPA
ncbi:MAG: M48 family metalloprotease [Actinoplanes sp.]